MVSGETIAAIATAPGRAGIGVVRVSGSSLAALAQHLTRQDLAPRRATLADFRDAAGALIDRGIALFFPAPHSYTGEDVLELQAHGGDIVLRMLLARTVELGARLARPGEFTQRAFLNDKLDLAQAESVADLIEASTEEAARSALRSLSGEFSVRVNTLVADLTELRALVEATLDFPEEEGVEFLASAQAALRLTGIQENLKLVLASSQQGALLRNGLQVALLGAPNVGKSSLLNRLAEQDLAIVTAIPGTTRDTVRERIQIEGVPLHIVDTAGLRETNDEVERLGIARTWAAAQTATIALVITDAQQLEESDAQDIIARLPTSVGVLHVVNKIDLSGEPPRLLQKEACNTVFLSAKTGAGMDLLKRELLRLAGWRAQEEGVFAARERHLAALKDAQARLAGAATNVGALELLAEELRLAQQALASITGEVSSDDLLGEIFSRFCIGK